MAAGWLPADELSARFKATGVPAGTLTEDRVSVDWAISVLLTSSTGKAKKRWRNIIIFNEIWENQYI